MNKIIIWFAPILPLLVLLKYLVIIPSAAAIDLDNRLIGHWRNTVHYPDMNYANDSHCRLYEDGSVEYYEKGISNGRKFSDGPVYGTWSADGSSLTLSFDTAEPIYERYQVEGDTLLLLDETESRLWKRIK